MVIPSVISNWIEGNEGPSEGGKTFDKFSPANGTLLWKVSRSGTKEIDQAVRAAKTAQEIWARTPGVQRGNVLFDLVSRLEANREAMAKIVAQETGKSVKHALEETGAAISLGRFMAGEGQRMYGRTTMSGVPNRTIMTLRRPIGVAGLIVAANTPIANVAWKVFPALICGNGAVLKPAEDTPATAWFFGKLASETALPKGLFSVVQGLGEEAGEALVRHSGVDIVSFTGSTEVGKHISKLTSERLARVSLELGGKNPLVVCDDADLEEAAKWAILSAFSNAGQRCASGSRVIIFEKVYETFKSLLLKKTAELKVGTKDDDDFGPVINSKQLSDMLSAIEEAKSQGAKILCGGKRLDDAEHKGGYYLSPTWIESLSPTSAVSERELFGPISVLYRARDFQQAVELANQSPYGLTSAIHTRSLDRAFAFTEKILAGVVSINAGTYGSEPHMPFGGYKQSGNGTREPGTESLDVYSELKNVHVNFRES